MNDWYSDISILIWVYKSVRFLFRSPPDVYSVECQTKSLSNLCVRFIMFPIFLAIYKTVLLLTWCVVGYILSYGFILKSIVNIFLMWQILFIYTHTFFVTWSRYNPALLSSVILANNCYSPLN